MPEGLVTLLAVLVGGVLTYVVQARLDERRAKRERERDRVAAMHEQARREADVGAELRAASRLVLEDLDTIALQLALIVRARRFPDDPPKFPTAAWKTYRATFAARFVDEIWEPLAGFMNTLPVLEAILVEAEPGAEVDPTMVERLRASALGARDLHATLSGRPTPSVNEYGEPA
jgi:hypothetical protein